MADIKKELNDIKNAVYGKEVRGAIHDGIKKINNEVENATDLSVSAKHQVENIQQQVNQLVVEGDSSVEAAQARVDAEGKSYPTLKARLDAKETQFSSQLAQTDWDLLLRGINVKNPPGSLTPVESDVEEDQSAKINDIIKYANQNGIENIIFPAGDYWVDPSSYDGVPDASRGGIELLDNISIILHPDTKIKALRSDGEGYNIFRAFRKKNIKIIGGKIIGERNTHIGTTGEWGHGVNLRGCENVYIDTIINDCWGDGLYLGSGGAGIPCKNIFIKYLETNNNRRQGLSLTHVDGFYFDVLVLNETNGTAPSAGIDFEPNAGEFVKNGFINSIYAEGNERAGVQFYAEREGAIIEDIVIDKIITKNNRDGVLYRGKNVKGVKINTVISKGNTRDGFRVYDGATGLVVGLLITEDNADRGLGISGSEGNVFKFVKAINNGIIGFEFSGGSGENIVEMLKVVSSETSEYGIAGYNSSGMKIVKAIVDKSERSGLFLYGVSDCEISIETKKSKSYPIRLNNSHKNKINGAFINEPLFNEPDVYSLIRLEGGSSENEITNTSSKITGNKARYAVQYVENSHNNFVGFNNFKGAYVTDMIYDPNSANNSMYNFPDQ